MSCDALTCWFAVRRLAAHQVDRLLQEKIFRSRQRRGSRMSANRIDEHTHRRVRRSAALSAAISSCLAMAAASQAHAQTKSDSIEEVVVTGFRASLADA